MHCLVKFLDVEHALVEIVVCAKVVKVSEVDHDQQNTDKYGNHKFLLEDERNAFLSELVLEGIVLKEVLRLVVGVLLAGGPCALIKT